MTILEKLKFEEDWLSEVNLTKENIKIALAGIRATVLEQQPTLDTRQRERQLEMEYQKGYDKGWEEGRKALEQQPSDSNISDPCDGCRYELNSTNGNPCYSCGKYKLSEQQPSEDTEVIKIGKGAVKSRQGRFVIYDVEWLKENFYSTEEKIYGQPKQPCKNCINRESLKQKLQEEHDFFVNAYGGNFKDMPYAEKVRVDEITNCIAMVVNEPPVTPQRPNGKWIKVYSGCRDCHIFYYKCSSCEYTTAYNPNYCCECGSYNPETVIDESADEWAKQLWNMEQCGNGGRP